MLLPPWLKCDLAERMELVGSHIGGGRIRGWGEQHTNKFTSAPHGISKTDADYLSTTPPLNEIIKLIKVQNS